MPSFEVEFLKAAALVALRLFLFPNIFLRVVRGKLYI